MCICQERSKVRYLSCQKKREMIAHQPASTLMCVGVKQYGQTDGFMEEWDMRACVDCCECMDREIWMHDDVRHDN